MGQRLARILAIRNLIRFGVPLAILLGALMVRVAEPFLVERAQLVVFDTYQRIKPREYDPDAPVRIVDIDDESLAKIGQWPWPRTRVADLVRRLVEKGAAVIAFDIVFAEPDRTSPRQVLPLWPPFPEVKALIDSPDKLPDHDAALAAAIKENRVVLGFVLSEQPGGRKPRVGGTVAWGGEDPVPWIPAFAGAISNLPEIENAAAGNGSFNMAPGLDGLVRRVPLVVRYGERREGTQVYASLATEALRVAEGQRTIVGKASGASGEMSFGERTGITQMRIGSHIVPTDKNGALLVYYTGHRQQRFVPAWKVLDGSVDPAEIDGRILFVGTSAAGLMDLRSSPIDLVLPGVEVHAEAVEQIVAGAFLVRPDWATGVELVLLAVLGLAMVVLIPFVGAAGCALLGATAIAAACGTSWYAFSQYHWLIDPFFPSVAALAVYFAGSLLSYLQAEADRRQIRTAFNQYMSPALVEQLAQQPERLKLGGETKTMSILFCDVRGFTAISEQFKHNPQGLTELINRLLTPLTDVIMAHDGTIDKYMGDAIMAFWNAPLDVPDHAARAVDAALGMFVEIDRLNEARAQEAETAGTEFKELAIGIGINTGVCVVGNMGSQQRFDYSVLGDAVNLASRLEGQSKTYGVGLVIGQETAAAIDGRFALLELDLIAVKGKLEGVRIFTAIGAADRAGDPAFKAAAERHAAMLARYRAQEWDAAESALAALWGACDGAMDDYYVVIAERIAAFRIDPPGPGWDGVYRATSK
ncbi:MAG: adenylate/guanylate cyclase domain-containing protein [Alphaproteobacteria bacterium]|nr:adenylate/guanylate cyclase domain-containing protein [Alphaproteobacteria bacterium]